jgi:hypothetical protein
VSGSEASMANTLKPISETKNFRSLCFIWKNSLVPWVASPRPTMRASPTMVLKGRRSSKGASAETPFRGHAAARSQACTAGVAGLAMGLRARSKVVEPATVMGL